MRRVTFINLEKPRPCMLCDGSKAQKLLYDRDGWKAIAVPLIEYTIKPGDRITIFLSELDGVLWWRINDGPLIKVSERDHALAAPTERRAEVLRR